MTIDSALQQLNNFRTTAPLQFHEQIERVDRARRDLGLGGIGDVPVSGGIGVDRSGELMPVERPVLHTRFSISGAR